jgi:hypothetical protein
MVTRNFDGALSDWLDTYLPVPFPSSRTFILGMFYALPVWSLRFIPRSTARILVSYVGPHFIMWLVSFVRYVGADYFKLFISIVSIEKDLFNYLL